MAKYLGVSATQICEWTGKVSLVSDTGGYNITQQSVSNILYLLPRKLSDYPPMFLSHCNNHRHALYPHILLSTVSLNLSFCFQGKFRKKYQKKITGLGQVTFFLCYLYIANVHQYSLQSMWIYLLFTIFLELTI